ncbi:hypothetical protein CG712_01715 [Streptococcus thermophilus]|nr:hypothetical protein CG712_01715 [Streptococcus thermophilus]
MENKNEIPVSIKIPPIYYSFNNTTMPPVMFSVVTKYHKGRHSLFLYNSEIFYAFTQDILRSRK